MATRRVEDMIERVIDIEAMTPGRTIISDLEKASKVMLAHQGLSSLLDEAASHTDHMLAQASSCNREDVGDALDSLEYIVRLYGVVLLTVGKWDLPGRKLTDLLIAQTKEDLLETLYKTCGCGSRKK